ncbi:MAG: hypothetical protein FJX59_05560 [Alphaproteobacteria bacterium]|nr:hypothetical protein [Alphaproteobacteria bacterium]
MAIEPTLESALGALRADLLSRLGNSAQASQETQARRAVGEVSDQASNARDLNTATVPPEGQRGRQLDIKV